MTWVLTCGLLLARSMRSTQGVFCSRARTIMRCSRQVVCHLQYSYLTLLLLQLIFELKGKPSKSYIRSGQFKDQHFDSDYKSFLYQDIDSVTKQVRTRAASLFSSCSQPKISALPLIKSVGDLGLMLQGEQTLVGIDKKQLALFRDLLDNMLMVDPAKRFSPKDALGHKFFEEKIEG